MKKYRLSLIFFLASLLGTLLGVYLGLFSFTSTTLVSLVFLNACFLLGQMLKEFLNKKSF